MQRLGGPVGRWLSELATAGNALVPPQAERVWVTAKGDQRLVHMRVWIPAALEPAVSAKIKEGLVQLHGVPGGAAAATWEARPCLEPTA